MNRLLQGTTASVRYKGQAFDQSVHRLRYTNAAPYPTLLLFTGMPKHQMQHAARALAVKLGKQLYRINLGAVSNKYIGETEKNLDRLLNRAAASNWILFFEEADALFGKRTNVKDAHDRYANQETGYLLQRLEQYKGVIIALSQHERKKIEKGKRIRKVIVKFPPD